jgi:hypothetical protein
MILMEADKNVPHMRASIRKAETMKKLARTSHSREPSAQGGSVASTALFLASSRCSRISNNSCSYFVVPVLQLAGDMEGCAIIAQHFRSGSERKELLPIEHNQSEDPEPLIVTIVDVRFKHAPSTQQVHTGQGLD